MCDKDLEARDDLRQRYAAVLQPVLDDLTALNKDEVVVALAPIVDLDLVCVSTSHDDRMLDS